MKKTAAILILAMVIGGFNSEVKAGSNGADGFILGAGGGALLGQAIGRNTESTLIGTAIGSMLGYVIGNEHDKYGTVQTRTTYRSVDRLHKPPRQYYTESRIPPARHQEEVCRDSEIIATVDGRPERIFTTVCLEDGRWVIAGEDVRINQTIIMEDDNRHGKNSAAYWGHRKHGHKNNFYRQARHSKNHRNRWYDDRYYYRSRW